MHKSLLFSVLIIIFFPDLTAQDHWKNYSNSKVWKNLNRASRRNCEVEILDLSYQKLDKIPSKVFELKALKVLILRGNNITNVPSDIAKLDHLKFLNLMDNQLIELPKEIGSLDELEHLLLMKNYIKYVPEELKQLKQLKQLNIAYNPIDQDLGFLKEELPTCEIIEIIEL